MSCIGEIGLHNCQARRDDVRQLAYRLAACMPINLAQARGSRVTGDRENHACDGHETHERQKPAAEAGRRGRELVQQVEIDLELRNV